MINPPYLEVGIEGIWNGLNNKFQHRTTFSINTIFIMTAESAQNSYIYLCGHQARCNYIK